MEEIALWYNQQVSHQHHLLANYYQSGQRRLNHWVAESQFNFKIIVIGWWTAALLQAWAVTVWLSTFAGDG